MRIYKRFNVTSTDTSTVNAALAEALSFIQASLSKLFDDKEGANRAQLMAEEALVSLVEHGEFETLPAFQATSPKGEARGFIQVSIRRFLGNVTVKLIVSGGEFDFAKSLELGAPLELEDGVSPDAASTIRNILLRSFGDRLRYKHNRDYNQVSITAVRSPLASLYWTFGALLLAVATGLLMNAFAPQAICNIFNSNVLMPFQTVFMNVLKLCAVPVVFLSIASCVAQFGDLSEVKRIGMRLLACFTVMQGIAAAVGIAIFYIFQPGRGVEIADVSRSAVYQGAKLSVLDTLINLVPSNIIRPFLEGNMLQLIVLALIVGVAVGTLGSKAARNFLYESNRVFMKITSSLMHFIPIIVFCSIASLFLTTGPVTLLSLLGLIVMTLTGFAVLIALYYIIVAFKCGLNPAWLFSKSLPMLITAFSTCSSIASIPDGMRGADKMGISPKIYSLSIPLGFSLNKNGMCMYIAAGSLFLARVYGVEIPPSRLLFLLVSVVVLVIGAPSASGAGVIAFSIMMSQLGVPVEAVSLIMGINPVLDMLETPVNCMGTMTATLITAAELGRTNNNMFDAEVYGESN